MDVLAIPAFQDNYIWLLQDSSQRFAAVVDPGDAKPVLSYLKDFDLELSFILLTHNHPDHTGGVHELLAAFPNVMIYGVQDDRLTFPVNNADTFSVFEYHFSTLQTPGHTRSHICFYEPNLGLLFCGDTLFSAGCGRVFDGTIEQLYQSIEQLKALPDTTQVYCGHEYTQQNLKFALRVEPDNVVAKYHLDYLSSQNHRCSLPSTIEFEKKINPFFRLDKFVHLENKTVINKPDKINKRFIFEQLRILKDQFKS